MTPPLRLALLVDPLSTRAPNAARAKAVRHALELARSLEARQHVARVFGLAPRGVPSSAENEAELGQRLNAFLPDAVLSYDALSPAAWVGSRLARRRRVPLLLVEAGSFAQGSWMERTAWRLGEVLWGAFVRRVANTLIALDPVARRQALREGFREERVQLLPHGVDIERFRPGLPCPLVALHRIRGRILLHPGPLDGRSGADLLIQAFARTLGGRDDWSLVLVCDGRLPARLRACADRLGVGARVHGLVADREQLPGLLSASTLMALPATDDSPLGASVARILACGCPLVASDLPRLRHFVERADAGVFARPGDLTAWVAALGQAVSSPQARKRWGANARACAERELDWGLIAAAFERALVEAAARARPAPAENDELVIERAS